MKKKYSEVVDKYFKELDKNGDGLSLSQFINNASKNI